MHQARESANRDLDALLVELWRGLLPVWKVEVLRLPRPVADLDVGHAIELGIGDSEVGVRPSPPLASGANGHHGIFSGVVEVSERTLQRIAQPLGVSGGAATVQAAEPGRRLTAERAGEDPGVGFMIAVSLRISAELDFLSHVVDVCGFPVVDLDQGVVELSRRIVRIHQLFLGAPALRGALLEETNRVAIAIVKIANARFLIGRGKGDGGSTGWQTAAHRYASDDRGEMGLVEIDHGGSVVDRRDTSLLPGDGLSQIPGTQPPERSDAGSDQEDKRDSEAAKSADCCGSQMRSVRV